MTIVKSPKKEPISPVSATCRSLVLFRGFVVPNVPFLFKAELKKLIPKTLLETVAFELMEEEDGDETIP
jgi:hypothetical protein